MGTRIRNSIDPRRAHQDANANGQTAFRRRYNLTSLTRRICRENRHAEMDWGLPRGREVGKRRLAAASRFGFRRAYGNDDRNRS